jgi:hypothetical protein
VGCGRYVGPTGAFERRPQLRIVERPEPKIDILCNNRRALQRSGGESDDQETDVVPDELSQKAELTLGKQRRLGHGGGCD